MNDDTTKPDAQVVEGIRTAARALLDSLDATAMKVTPEFRGTLEQLARNPVREGK